MKCVILFGLMMFSAKLPPPELGSNMKRMADRFLGALSAEQRHIAVRKLDDDEARNWHYVPKERIGVSWAQMNPAQKKAATDLLRTSLSEIGFKTIEEIRNLEDTLREREGGNLSRDKEKYHFTFFGAPSDTAPWLWRYEGHHLSLTFAIANGHVVSSTPQFLGASPADSHNKVNAMLRPLGKHQDIAFEFMNLLTPDQRKVAVLSDNAPADIATGNQRELGLIEKKGLQFSNCNGAQRKLLMDLIRTHAEVQSNEVSKLRMKSAENSIPSSIVFAWMGPVSKKGQHYYRIQSDKFLIEYDNTQEDGNHIHTVWRDFKNDFGGDLLKVHYQSAEHTHSHR